jgi:hypothetical protein
VLWILNALQRILRRFQFARQVSVEWHRARKWVLQMDFLTTLPLEHRRLTIKSLTAAFESHKLFKVANITLSFSNGESKHPYPSARLATANDLIQFLRKKELTAMHRNGIVIQFDLCSDLAIFSKLVCREFLSDPFLLCSRDSVEQTASHQTLVVR